MNCTDSREQLALRLYHELDEREAAGLQLHLEACAACRAFSAELGQGLGRLAANAPDDLPAGWADQLRGRVGTELTASAVRSERQPRRAAGLGLAAGFLLGLAGPTLFIFANAKHFNGEQGRVIEADLESEPLPAFPEAREDRLAIEVDSNPEHEFRRSIPPPLALAGGDLGRLQTYLSR